MKIDGMTPEEVARERISSVGNSVARFEEELDRERAGDSLGAYAALQEILEIDSLGYDLRAYLLNVYREQVDTFTVIAAAMRPEAEGFDLSLQFQDEEWKHSFRDRLMKPPWNIDENPKKVLKSEVPQVMQRAEEIITDMEQSGASRRTVRRTLKRYRKHMEVLIPWYGDIFIEGHHNPHWVAIEPAYRLARDAREAPDDAIFIPPGGTLAVEVARRSGVSKATLRNVGGTLYLDDRRYMGKRIVRILDQDNSTLQ